MTVSGVFSSDPQGLEEMRVWLSEQLGNMVGGEFDAQDMDALLDQIMSDGEEARIGRGIFRITLGNSVRSRPGRGSRMGHLFRDWDFESPAPNGPDCAICSVRADCDLPKKHAWEASQRSQRPYPGDTLHPFGLGDFGVSGFELFPPPRTRDSHAVEVLAALLAYERTRRRQRLVNRAWRGIKSVGTVVLALIALPFFKVLEFGLHAYTWNKQDQHREECRTARAGARFGGWVSRTWARRPWRRDDIVVTDEEVWQEDDLGVEVEEAN